MRPWLTLGLLSVALAGCEQKLHSTQKDAPALPSVAVAPAGPTEPPAAPDAPAAPPKARPKPVVYPTGWAPPARTDTALVLDGRPYRMRLEAETDSARRLATAFETAPGRFEQAHGFEGRYTITLHDGQGIQVFRRQLRKAAFFKRAGADIVTESEAYVPNLLGYSRPLGALAFTVDFMVPDSDVGSQVVLLLDLAGNVLRISDGRSPGTGPECDPALSPSGGALLTGTEVLRAHLPPLRLEKLNADLVGASFLTDTTLLVVYAPGKSHPIRYPDGLEAYGRTPSAEQQRAPNAFVRHVRTGRVLSRFRYYGYYEEMGFTIPGYQLRATATHYLLDEQRGLYLLPLRGSAAPSMMRFTVMPRYFPPRRPAEARFELHGSSTSFAFYVDTLSRHPSIRYQRLAE